MTPLNRERDDSFFNESDYEISKSKRQLEPEAPTLAPERRGSLIAKVKMNPGRPAADDQDYTYINQLAETDQKAATILEDLLGKRLVLMLFSKQAGLRAQALVDLNRGVKKFEFDQVDLAERQEIFVAIFAVINKGCSDNNFQVNLEAIETLLSLLESHSSRLEEIKEPDLAVELQHHVLQIIDGLLIKIGETNHKLKTNAHTALRKISNFEIMNYRMQIDRIILADGRHAKTKSAITKNFILGRLKHL